MYEPEQQQAPREVPPLTAPAMPAAPPAGGPAAAPGPPPEAPASPPAPAPKPVTAPAADPAEEPRWRNPAPRLVLVVPCYNEQEVLPDTMRQLAAVLDDLVLKGLVLPSSFALYVDDGSRDTTWDLISRASAEQPGVAGVKLARNAGHQKALLAGIHEAARVADCIVSIDADLQDDIRSIEDMVVKYREGDDVVYGVRRERDTDTAFKRGTALGFYRFLRMMGVDIVPNHADYRLMSRRALEQLERFGEVNLFLRGIVPLLGFPSARVYYDRKARTAGESKYPLKKMLAFAADGITSFSLTPLRYIAVIGVALMVLSVLGGIAAAAAWGAGRAVPGWVAVLVSVWFVGGLAVTALGLVGEYVGKTYQEAKRRPRFVIETVLDPRPADLRVRRGQTAAPAAGASAPAPPAPETTPVTTP